MRDLFLIRGLPGSGKSTIAELITDYSHVFSADDYMIDENGEYRFIAENLSNCHKLCMDSVFYAMIDDQPIIVVANTFTREWEMEGYYKIAEKYGYRVHTIIVENRHNGESIHNVPEYSMKNMENRFELKL